MMGTTVQVTQGQGRKYHTSINKAEQGRQTVRCNRLKQPDCNKEGDTDIIQLGPLQGGAVECQSRVKMQKNAHQIKSMFSCMLSMLSYMLCHFWLGEL
jgi:hypothetical protein